MGSLTKRLRLLMSCAAALLSCAPLTQASHPDLSVPTRDPEITQQLAQTLGFIFSITVQDYFIASRWNRPGSANLVETRLLTPFEVWGQKNLLRLSVPFRTESELGPGLSDVRLFDLLIFKMSGGFWGVGPVFNLGINRGPGIDTLQLGPAAAIIITSAKLSIGALNQNFFSGDVAFTTLQPILVYQPTKSWTLSLGELPLVYNFKKSRFAVFSVGLQIGYTADIANQPVRFFINPQYNTRSSTQLYRWTFASGFTLPLLPPKFPKPE